MRSSSAGLAPEWRRDDAEFAIAAPASERQSSAAFAALMAFTFVLFVAPQAAFPILAPLHLAKVTAGLALVTYLMDRFLGGAPWTVWFPAMRSVVLLVVFALVSIPFSRWPGGSFDALFNEFGKSVLIFFLIANLVNTVRRFKWMIGSMAVWGALMSGAALSDYASGNLAVEGIRILGYDAPLTADPNDLALTLNLILGLILGLRLATSNLLARAILLAAMVLLAGAVIATFSRGGFLTLVTVLCAFIWLGRRRHLPSIFAPVIVSVALLGVVLSGDYGMRVYSIVDHDYDGTGSAGVRWAGMMLAVRLMFENPFAGLGLGMHLLEFPERGLPWQSAHNAFLQIGADMGIAAFCVFIMLVWQLAKALRQEQARLSEAPEARGLLFIGTGIELALLAYVVGAFFLPVAYRFYFYYVAGMAVAFQGITTSLRQRLDERAEDRNRASAE